MTVKELYARAKELRVIRYSKMNKKELESAIAKAEADIKLKEMIVQQEGAGKELSDKEFDEIISHIDKRKEEEFKEYTEGKAHHGDGKKKGEDMSKFTFIKGKRVVASDTEMYPGKHAILQQKEDGSHVVVFREGDVPILMQATVRKAALESGKFTPIRIQYSDVDLRITAMNLTIDRLHKEGIEKYGKPLYPVFWHTDTSNAKGLVGFKEDFDELFGVDIFAGKDPVRLIEYDTPVSVQITNSTKEYLNFLVLDVVGPNGEAYWDGQTWMNVVFKYESYLSEKDKEKGKKTYHIHEDTVQLRAFIPAFLKGQGAMAPQFVHDACLSYGIKNYEDYDGVISFDTMKTNPLGLKHGDSFKIKATDLKIVNMLTENPVSSTGVQMVTHKPSAVLNFCEELNIAENGRVFRGIIDGDIEEAYKMLSAPKMRTMEDADIAHAMFLAMAVPDGTGSYRVMRCTSIYNKYIARAVKFYQNDVLKIETAALAAYAIACPIILPDENGNMVDALSMFERLHYKETGEMINYTVFPDDDSFIRKAMAKRYLNSHRHPVVGPGSVQRDTNLPKEYVEKLQAMGFKSIYMKEVDGKEYAVCPVKHGYMISYDKAQAQNGDFDGDMQYYIPSDTADFGVIRMPEAKPEEASGEKLEYTYENYYKFLKYKYAVTINSQPMIGLVDLLVRRVIEENRLNKAVLTPSQYMELARIREQMIQGRKHLTKDIDLDNPPSMEEQFSAIQRVIVKNFHYNKRMSYNPKDAPATHKLKVFGASGMGARTETGMRAINNIISLVKAAKRQPNYYNDPYAKSWDYISDARQLYYVEDDAKYWGDKFTTLWNNLKRGDKEILGINVTPKRMIEVASFVSYLNEGQKSWREISVDEIGEYSPHYYEIRVNKNPDDSIKSYDIREYGYSQAAKLLLRINDEHERRTEFFRLGKRADIKVKRFIEDSVGFDETKVDLLKKLIIIRLGMVGFGSGRNQEGEKYSFGGRTFWRMKNKYIFWVTKLVHPDNKMIDRLIEEFGIKL